MSSLAPQRLPTPFPEEEAAGTSTATSTATATPYSSFQYKSNSHSQTQSNTATTDPTTLSSRSGGSHTAVRWSAAIQAVLAHQRFSEALHLQRQNSQDGRKKKEDPPDPLGEALQRIFNQRPEFSYPREQHLDHVSTGAPTPNKKPSSLSASSPAGKFRYPPLLSRHNARVLQHYLGRAWLHLKETVASGQSLSHRKQQQPANHSQVYPLPSPKPLSYTQTIHAAAVGLAIGVLLVGVLIGMVTLVAIQTTWHLSTAVLLFLLDWQEVVPDSLQRAWKDSIDYLDQVILRAHAYRDREWAADGSFFTPTSPHWTSSSMALLPASLSGTKSQKHISTVPTRTSVTQSLWALPPPTIAQCGKRLALDPQHLQRPNWSSDTVQHVLAIDFCYVMLHEHELRRQARRSRAAAAKAGNSKIATAAAAAQSKRTATPPPVEEDWGDVLLVASDDRFDESIELQVSSASQDESGGDVGFAQERPWSPSNPLLLRDDDGTEDGPHHKWILGKNNQDDEGRDTESDVQSTTSDVLSELPWLDVGAKIGMRLLNSAHVHRAVASTETTEFLMASSQELLQLDNGTASSAVTTTFSAVNGGTSLSHPGSGYSTGLLMSPGQSIVSSTAATTTLATTMSSPMREPSLPEIVLPSLQVAGGSVAPGIVIRKPVHPLWTSPGAALHLPDDSDSLWSLSPPVSPHTSPPSSPKLHRLTVPASLSSPTSLTVPSIKSLPRRHSEDHLPALAEASRRSKPPSSSRRRRIRPPLSPGVRVAVPVTPFQPDCSSHSCQRRNRSKNRQFSQQYQMGSVVRSERIWIHEKGHADSLTPNCLTVTVKLERSFLRNGEFADLTFRVMDHWPDRFMPKHSKVPIGSCVATAFGLGVLIGWRVEDDMHVVRSLWRRRGPGSGHAYLNRSAIHGVVEAAVGFSVETSLGTGQVISYVNGGPRFEHGQYFVDIATDGTHHIVPMKRKDIFSCHGAQFIPVIEHIRAAANYQVQLDMYRDSFDPYVLEDDNVGMLSPRLEPSETFLNLSEILWSSFCRAVDENKDFDVGVNAFMTSIIEFLERLDGQGGAIEEDVLSVMSDDFAVECVATGGTATTPTEEQAPAQEPGFWFTNDIFGGVFGSTNSPPAPMDTGVDQSPSVASVHSSSDFDAQSRSRHLERFETFLQTLLNTVSYARVDCVDKPHFRLGLAVTYDVLLFLRTIVKVQQKNMSVKSLRVWKRAFEEISSTFGPIKDRLERIGQGIAQRMEQQGKKAKAKVIKFVDFVLGDERLLIALEHGDWDRCVKQLETALVHSAILDRENLVYYRKTLTFLYDHLRLTLSNQQGAARRNSEKIAILAKVIQWIAAPRRSLLKLFERDDVLDVFERILVRVFHKEELASRKVMIHALNFHSLRHLRMLKDFSTSGRLWMPVLDAADEEVSWMVSHMPPNTKDIMCPIANLFSLCVAQFHRIAEGDLTHDWMDFLLQDDAVRIIHDIDMKLILALESLSRDVKEMMTALPYYSNIDVDILNLMDEVDLDEFLKEASSAVDDPEKLTHFIREKATIAVQRFLDWLPRISIPVEKRDLMEGWVLTCRGEDGGDLTLSDVSVKKENLVCQIMGGDALFFPMFGDDADVEIAPDDGIVESPHRSVSSAVVEESVLDNIREMLIQAERFGCWKAGVGGVGEPPTDRYVASVLHGLPVSAVLNCGIEMWRNLEIDDDELLEIAIKDVSYQIQLQKIREEGEDGAGHDGSGQTELVPPSFSGSSVEVRMTDSSFSTMDGIRNRFNPRVDPTVLFLDMKNLTLRLDNFMFRIEKNKNPSILDPIFEGKGSLTIQNVSIKMRVECAKERIRRTALGETFAPVLILKELVTTLEQVKLRVRDTAFGSDWLVNKAVHAFSEDITKAVEENLREQVEQQAKSALENLNAYFLLHPNMLLNLLGISLDDLDDNVLWV